MQNCNWHSTAQFICTVHAAHFITPKTRRHFRNVTWNDTVCVRYKTPIDVWPHPSRTQYLVFCSRHLTSVLFCCQPTHACPRLYWYSKPCWSAGFITERRIEKRIRNHLRCTIGIGTSLRLIKIRGFDGRVSPGLWCRVVRHVCRCFEGSYCLHHQGIYSCIVMTVVIES